VWVALTNLPLILPPTVLGYALLVAFSKRSALGHLYETVAGQPLVFTWQGAVAASCLASIPLFISHARVAIAAVDRDVVEAARLDGAGPAALLRAMILPLARPGIAAGIALTFARALGDFGATLMVAGDTPGLTQTMPLAIYDAVMNDDAHVVKVFVALSVAICLVVTILASRWTGE
jgi:molybdate transport system permease protein